MNVELLYFDGCPGYAQLHESLPELVRRAGVQACVVERRVVTAAEARRLRFLGSPTVRVNGVDVERTPRAVAGGYGLACRLYATEKGMHRTPPEAWIRTALAAALGDGGRVDPLADAGGVRAARSRRR